MDRRALLTALVLLLVALAGCDGPPPQTEVVCDGCVTGLEESAPNVTVDESVTHVYLRESGDARVEARLDLSGSGVDQLRADERRRQRVVDRITAEDDSDPYEDRTRPAFPREDVAVETDGETLVVTFRYPNFSERRVGGTTLADGFYRMDGEGRENELDYDEPTEFETDRLVVHGPDGTRALVTPPESTGEGGDLVWTDGTVPPRTYLAFGGSALAGRVAVALEVLSWAGPPAAFAAVASGFVLLAQSLLLVGLYVRRLDGTPDWDPGSDGLFWVLVGLELAVGALAVGWFFLDALVGVVAMLAVAAAVVAAYARASDASEGDRSPDDESADPGPGDPTADSGAGVPAANHRSDARSDGDGPVATTEPSADSAIRSSGGKGFRRFRGHALAAAAIVAVTGVLTAAVAVDYTAAYAGTVALAAAAVPLVTFPAFGYLVTVRGRGPQLVGAVGATAASAWVVPLGQIVRSGGEDAGLTVFVVLAWALAACAVGLLGFYGALWVRSR